MGNYADKNGFQYCISKIKILINKKTDLGHKHTKGDITDFPASMPPTSHSHDDRYYTEAEINSKLNGKANSSHSHPSSSIEISQSTVDAYKSMGMA